MSLKSQNKIFDNYSIVQISGKGTDENDYKNVLIQIEELIENHNPNLIINLKDLELINSLGLNFLIKIFTKSRNLGGDMYIVNISDKINQVLLLTKLNTVLNIAESLKDAEEKLKHNNQ